MIAPRRLLSRRPNELGSLYWTCKLDRTSRQVPGLDAGHAGKLAGRAVAEEPGVNVQCLCRCLPWAENSSGPTSSSSTSGGSSGTSSTSHCRLLDEQNLRYASGTLRRMPRRPGADQTGPQLAADERQGRRRAARPGDAAGRRWSRSAGIFATRAATRSFNVEYPSTQYDMAEHARRCGHLIDHLDGIEEINFVGHSMGNIVIRHYLGDLARQDPVKQSANAAAADRRAKMRFGRFVMLGPPNQGALLAETLADNVLFKEIAGDAGQQLGRDWPQLEKHLATPDFPFGIIAGGKGNEQGYNPILLTATTTA